MPDAVTLFVGVYNPNNKYTADELIESKNADVYFTRKENMQLKNYVKYYCGEVYFERDLIKTKTSKNQSLHKNYFFIRLSTIPEMIRLVHTKAYTVSTDES